MVVEEGGEARTINFCQQCCNEQLVQQGKLRLKVWQWKGVMGFEQFTRGMWEYFTLERTGARKILADASREKQEGIQHQKEGKPSEWTLERIREGYEKVARDEI